LTFEFCETCRAALALRTSGTNYLRLSSIDIELLRELIEAWPTLTEQERQSIACVVEPIF
jgi:hypothetical protein